MTLLRLDYETACDLDLKKVGLDAYARHPSCRILMASWALDDGPVQQWTCDMDRKLLQPMIDLLEDDSVDVEAHNMQFERAISYHVLGIYIDLERCTCTMALAFMLGLPGGLEKLGEVVKMPEKYQKHKRGKYLIGKFCKPRKPTKNKPWAWDTSLSEPELWAEFCEYNRQDVEAERFLYTNRLSKYPVLDAEWGTWRLDQTINERGIPLDMDFVNEAVTYADDTVRGLIAELRVVTGMTDPMENPNSDAQFGPWVRQRGYSYGDLRKETVARALAEPFSDLTDLARKGLTLRAMIKRTSLQKFHAMQRSACADRLRYQFQFCGAARTGRWGGRGVQPQNFPRPKKAFESDKRQYDIIESIKHRDQFWIRAAYSDSLTALSSCLRAAIRAPEGCKLVVADLSSIESAVLAWLADCPAMLEVFRTGKDIYKAFAVVWLRKLYEDVTKEQRNLAKPPTLGCGFRLGPGAEVLDHKTGDMKLTGLRGYARNMGVEMTDEQAQSAVTAFREAYPEVVQFWYDLEAAAKTVIYEGGTRVVGHLMFEMRPPFLRIVLPSGRALHYLRPKIEQVVTPWGATKMTVTYEGLEDDGERKFWGRTPTHGGKLTENVVQAVANDLLRHGMQEAEAAGFNLVLHVHDELVAEEPTDSLLTYRDLEKAMTKLPPWATGMPVGAHGFETIHYKKD